MSISLIEHEIINEYVNAVSIDNYSFNSIPKA